MNIVLLGPPGSGKGTQAEKINKKYNIPHISTGDILRENIKKNTELGRLAKSYMDKGELVPDSLLIDLIKERLNQSDCLQGYILDGYPRTIPQASALEKINKKLDIVLNISVSDEELIKRLSGRRICKQCGASYHIIFNPPIKNGICDLCGGDLYQRDDDSEVAIKNRLKVYKKQTQPLIDYYSKKKLLVTINGENEILKIFEDICVVLDGLGHHML
ncbi:MAG: adenylate kinase [Methanosarcinales archaeon]